jgi:actin-related protein
MAVDAQVVERKGDCENWSRLNRQAGASPTVSMCASRITRFFMSSYARRQALGWVPKVAASSDNQEAVWFGSLAMAAFAR